VHKQRMRELFSLFSSFDGDCQSGSFVIQRNRDSFYAQVRRRSFQTGWGAKRKTSVLSEYFAF
jgi:hypothetical protein